MNAFEIRGVVPVVPTPFDREGAIDWPSLGNLLEFAVDAKVCAVCLPAYASEFYKLLDEERRHLVCEAIRILDHRLPVIAQVNQLSTAHAVETARALELEGAAAISVAVPRLFPLPERDLLRYFDRILETLTVPLVIQDFNPGGSTVSLEFVQALHRQHEHFRYLKLEEPLLSSRVQGIAEVTAGAVRVIDGWGGMYMLELIDAGICGVMPGLAVSDILQTIWQKACAGEKEGAYELFQGVLPQITYSLQSLEFFHHAEKALLVQRGVLPTAEVRDATLTISEVDRAHIEFLNHRILDLVRQQKTGRQPASSSTEISI